jgi:hypothetical protein
MLWQGRGGETCEQGWGLKVESRGCNHGKGRGGKWREKGSRSCGGGGRQSGRQAERQEKREQCWGIDRGIGRGGTEKNQRSEEIALEPVRNGWGEEGMSKRDTEVGVKIA